MTRVLFNVPVIDDDILEKSEYFSLAIDPSSLPDNVTVNVTNQTEVEIVDDDCKL